MSHPLKDMITGMIIILDVFLVPYILHVLYDAGFRRIDVGSCSVPKFATTATWWYGKLLFFFISAAKARESGGAFQNITGHYSEVLVPPKSGN